MRIQKLLKAQFSDTFSRAFIRLGGANAAAHLITIGSAPLLARIYEPELFGVFGVYLVVCSFGLSIGCFRLESALLLTRSQRKAALVLTASAGAAILSSLIIAGAAAIYLRLVPKASVGFPLWLAFLGALASAFTTLLSALALRQQNYKGLSRSRLTQSAGAAIFQFALGLAGAGPIGLIGGDVIGRTLGALQLLFQTRSSRWGAPALPLLAARLKEHRALLYFSFPNTILNTLALQAPAILIPPLFGTAANGYYIQAQRLASAPLVLIGQALAQVFASELSARRRAGSGGLVELFWNSVKKSLLLGGLPVLIGFSTAPIWVPWIFGTDWALTGWVMLAMTPLTLSQLITSPISQTPTILGFQARQTRWELGRLAFLFSAFLLGGPIFGWSVLKTLLFYASGSALLYAGFVRMCFREIRHADET